MTDGDEQVWLTTATHRGSRSQRKLHTDPNCTNLQQAKNVSGPKSRSVFGDDREICKRCSGEMEPRGPDKTDTWQTLADPNFGPEDLGLDGGEA